MLKKVCHDFKFWKTKAVVETDHFTILDITQQFSNILTRFIMHMNVQLITAL